MANNEGSDLIEAALNEALKIKFDDYKEGDVLHEWVIVAHVANVDSENGDAYPMLFSNGCIPTHSARGLLHTALLMLNKTDEDD